MNRRLPASVSLTIALLAVPVGIYGCSASPDDAPVDSSPAAIAESMSAGGSVGSITCTEPLTAPAQSCARAGARFFCSWTCQAVTETPATSLSPAPTITPYAATSLLASLGCTVGIDAGRIGGHIWACPAAAKAQIPSSLGTICSPYRWIGEPPCTERVSTGTTMDGNPLVGNAKPGWILVEDANASAWADVDVDGGVIGGGCPGGCPTINLDYVGP